MPYGSHPNVVTHLSDTDLSRIGASSVFIMKVLVTGSEWLAKITINADTYNANAPPVRRDACRRCTVDSCDRCEPEEIMRRHFRSHGWHCVPDALDSSWAPRPSLGSKRHSTPSSRRRSSSTSRSSPRMNSRAEGRERQGEEKTVAYLTAQFQKMGLKPGNPDGTFVQNVPLVGFQAKQVTGAFRPAAGRSGCRFPTISSPCRAGCPKKVKVEKSDVVFVGYGVVAPEYGWDDYKGLDVRGKTLIMLVNDPPVADPKDPSKLDPAFFKGRAMTYYGRWTYKYEIASEKGAAAAILVHETGPAGYPFEVVRGSWSRENFDIAQPQSRPDAEPGGRRGLDHTRQGQGAVSSGRARLRRAQAGRRPPRFPARAARKQRSVRGHQRAARGQVAKRRRQDRGGRSRAQERDVIYTAHWDHLGRDPALKGDQIYNGAADNASGVASILEIAHALAQAQPAPKRSILFLAVTAEEKGLLGAKYYAAHPLYPLATHAG